MKLTNKDVTKRAEIKLNKSMSSAGGVMMFGKDNDYSNVIERIIAGSVTATAVKGVNSKFLVGNGFTNGLNDKVISTTSRGKEVTILDLLRQVSDSVAANEGLYIHNRVNLFGKTRDQQLFQFKTCKFTAVDDVNYTNSIVVNQEFGEAEFKKKNNVTYPVFNSDLKVIRSQFLEYSKNKKGFENTEEFQNGFPGQIYFHFFDNRYLYPLSPFDPVYLDGDTEAEVSLYKNRELRNGFMARTIVTVNEFTDEKDRQEFVKMIEGAEGADGTRLILVEAEYDEVTGEIKKAAAIKVDKIESTLDPDLFNNIEKSLSNNIRKNSKIPAILIDYEEGKLSTASGEAFVQAISYYNGMTRDDRAQLSRVFTEIMKNHIDPTISGAKDWDIEPISFEEKTDEVIDVGAEAKSAEAQATLRGSVGGVTAILSIQQSVGAGTTTRSAGIAMISEIFGYDTATAAKMLGDPVQTEPKPAGGQV